MKHLGRTLRLAAVALCFATFAPVVPAQAGVGCEQFSWANYPASDQLQKMGFEHGLDIGFLSPLMPYVTECGGGLEKVALLSKAKVLFAAQRVGGYVIFRPWQHGPGDAIAIREAADAPYSERQPLRLGVYRLVKMAQFEKTNGFAATLPLVEFVAPLPDASPTVPGQLHGDCSGCPT